MTKAPTPTTNKRQAEKHHKKHGDMDGHTCLLAICALHYPQKAKRGLTRDQRQRRAAILARLRSDRIETANELRSFLAQYHHIYITVDTVLKDLRAMEDAESVRRTKSPNKFHEWGGGRYIHHLAWTVR